MKIRIIRPLPCIFILMVFSMFLVYTPGMKAQNAPITLLATIGNAMPGQVNVPVTVTGFNNIGAISLCFDYQYAGLHYIQGTPNPLLGGFVIGDQDLGNGKHRVTMGWFGNGVTLPDGTAIMTVTFNYISGFADLEFYDNGPSCEYANDSYNVLNDIPQSIYYLNGKVCGNIGNPGPVSGASSICMGQTGVAYSIAPVVNATGYNWTLPAGATIASGNNTNAISVDFSPSAVSGNITVNGVNVCGSGPFSQLAVTVNVLPVANAGPDFSIPYGTNATLHAASGGAGSFNYHWSPEALLVDPNLQNPQTVNLTASAVFTLDVTNQTSLCKNTDEIVVSVAGGLLNVNPIAVPNSICQGATAQLFANAGGGSGNYTYTWSCNPPGSPPWSSNQSNPMVLPDSSKTYQLSVFDGSNTVQGSTFVTVFQLPSATIHGGDTLCGEGNSTVLTVDLTGTPPWTFYYSNGLTTWLVASQYTTPFSIFASEPGIYRILTMADSHCTGTTSGSAVVAVFPVPPAPEISTNGSELVSTGCCGNQWYRDGNAITGATDQHYQPSQTGHYFDIVTIDGCSSDSSNTIYYLMTGLRQPVMGSFSVEPNPAENFFILRSKEESPVIEKIQIYSITGKEEFNFSVNPMQSKNELTIDIHQLRPGLYFFAVGTKLGKTILKIIKK